MLEVTLQWTSMPSKGGVNYTLICFRLTNWVNSGHVDLLSSYCVILSTFSNKRQHEIYLIGMSVTTNDDRLRPPWYEPWNVLTDYCFSEHCSSKDVTDCSIRRFPHFLQLEL